MTEELYFVSGQDQTGEMLRKLVVIGGFLVLGTASAAWAGYETPTVSGTVVDGNVLVTGSGCMPEELVTYAVTGGTTVTSTATATGTFSAAVPLGALAGQVDITVTCGGVVQVLGVVVGGAPTQPARALAFTGSDSTTQLAIAGVLLVACGAGAVVLARRRRATNHV
jgi:LPXTG-motif cell wall-anchored protein